jgi:pyruvate dehydrogenase E2 component (dihydrolipoamide acetyltransferase)
VPEATADVPVNQLNALIAAEGEDPKSVSAAGPGAPAGAPAAPGPAQPAEAEAPKSQAPKSQAAPEAPPAPQPAPPSAAAAANGAGTSPTGGHAGTETAGRVFASPLARRLAKDSGIDVAAIPGSGPRGRVIERDVKAALAGGAKPAPAAAPGAPAKAPAPAPAPLAAAMGADQVKAMYEAGTYEEVPLDGMRKTVAKRLTESKQTVPHFYMAVDIELDALLSLREQINAGAPKDKDGAPAFKLSVNDFAIKALALALQRVPSANAVWAEDRILKFKHADVGVAVAIEGGLFTPVIKRADTKTLSAISAEMKDLAGRARKRRLKPEEYQGGATAISNLGMFGIKSFQAVINPPHGTILAVGAGEKRVVVKGDQPTVVQAMTVNLSVDHRVVDGALGAELLAAFKTLIENPVTMLV